MLRDFTDFFNSSKSLGNTALLSEISDMVLIFYRKIVQGFLIHPEKYMNFFFHLLLQNKYSSFAFAVLMQVMINDCVVYIYIVL